MARHRCILGSTHIHEQHMQGTVLRSDSICGALAPPLCRLPLLVLVVLRTPTQSRLFCQCLAPLHTAPYTPQSKLCGV